ncbi:MAG: hypothetical protein JO334_13950 [Verrucomicrobia bacterium]|nr:hypothetical protein [Verrucomicrobiota bacterium]
MSGIEDYPGPSEDHPEKEGQEPRGRSNEEMVKPASRPKPEKKEESAAKTDQESRRE